MAGDKIDGLERAISSYKIKFNNIVERLNMEICEIESRELNKMFNFSNSLELVWFEFEFW